MPGSHIVHSLGGAPERIQRLPIGHLLKADPEYGAGVAAGLGIAVADLEPATV